MTDSKISWTNKTWNPATGCSKVSEGCDFCYAERLSLQRGWTPAPWTRKNEEVNVRIRPERLAQPFAWRAPARVFVNSMSDLFHKNLEDDFIARVFAVMGLATQHTFQVLTKRPHRMARLLKREEWWAEVEREAYDLIRYEQVPGRRYVGPYQPMIGADGEPFDKRSIPPAPDLTSPLPNVWLGTSIENQKWADVRIPHLLRTPAAVRFLSCEPLLGPVNLEHYLGDPACSCPPGDGFHMPGVDWVIVGGESGPHLTGPDDPRWMRMEWARALRDQAAAAGVPFFFKQDSGRRSEMRPWIVEEDGSRTTWQQYPGGDTPL